MMIAFFIVKSSLDDGFFIMQSSLVPCCICRKDKIYLRQMGFVILGIGYRLEGGYRK